MVNPDKRRRQQDADTAKIQRLLKRGHSLSFALMRSAAAYEAFHREWAALSQGGETDDHLVSTILSAVTKIENNGLTRTSTMLALHLALLYAVVEKWREWKFEDPRVDRLLRSSLLPKLKHFRHAIFHADEFDHKDVMEFNADPVIVQWTGDLFNAIRTSLIELHEAVDKAVEAERVSDLDPTL